jgi:FKBP-type peptidyl-prolyl cis-trans isomerase FklB
MTFVPGRTDKTPSMKLNVSLAALLGMTLIGTRGLAAENAPVLKDQKDQVSYAIGVNIGTGIKGQFQQQGLDLKSDLVAAGFKDALSGAKQLLSEQQIRDVMMTFQREMVAKQAEAGEKNKKEGDAFLAENKKKPGIKTLPSGVQYQVLKEANGPKPKATDTVKANYKGTLINGTEFDSSDKHGEPATFNLSGVIPGWTEALQLMPVGSKWRLFIPGELAYGERGAGSVIGPNATLIFDVELLGVESSNKTAVPLPAR